MTRTEIRNETVFYYFLRFLFYYLILFYMQLVRNAKETNLNQKQFKGKQSDATG